MGAHEVLYDTSILIEAVRAKRKLVGYTTAINVIEFPLAKEISTLNVIYPQPKDFKLAFILANKLLELGKPVPATDLIIAAVAINRKLLLKTKDKHFEWIKKVSPELLLEITP